MQGEGRGVTERSTQTGFSKGLLKGRKRLPFMVDGQRRLVRRRCVFAMCAAQSNTAIGRCGVQHSTQPACVHPHTATVTRVVRACTCSNHLYSCNLGSLFVQNKP